MPNYRRAFMPGGGWNGHAPMLVVAGRYFSWGLLFFGALVGGLPMLGFPRPAPFVEKLATYAMALGVATFAAVLILYWAAFYMRHLRQSQR